MAFRDLREYIGALEQRGELKRITTPVSAELEITEIADRVVKRGGPALLFENVAGHHMPVLINSFGSAERTSLALGVSTLDELGDRIRKLMKLAPPAGLLDKLKILGDLREVARAAPKMVDRAACQEVVVQQPSLRDLPVLTCWPEDGGPFITFGLVITRHPRTRLRNVGMYRMQVYDERTAGLHWHKHKGGAEHYGEAGPRRTEVAVAIGPDPATTYAGSAPLPPIIDEFLLAGFLRRNPIYHTTIVGRPPMEDYYMGKATERLFLPLMQMIAPEIVDVNMPAEGVFHNLVIISIKKRYPGQPQKVMYGLWGMGQMMFARNLVIVDEDVDVQNLSEVAWRVTNNVDAKRDLVVVEGPVDALDHAAPRPYLGGKLGIDATRKTALDGYEREWPPDIVMSDEIKALVDRRWPEYGL
jgi:4-hydroxy-3-polyprenylbenzoate decarboxylase